MTDIQAGDVVIPKRNLKLTADRFSVDRNMRGLVGKRLKVSDVYGDCVTARGWSWHPKDLKIAPRRKAAR